MNEPPDKYASVGHPDRDLVLERLGLSGIDMIEVAPPDAPEPAQAVWRFESAEGDLTAEVYAVANGEEAASLWARLGGDASPTSPVDRQVGITGRLVFDVKFVGSADTAESGQWRLMAITGALAGDE